MSLKLGCDTKYDIIDDVTPKNEFVSGHYKRSCAYNTLHNHLPVVLTNVIDTLTKDKHELAATYGELSRDELKLIIGLISRLKYELQTDKTFQPFNGVERDRNDWNLFISHLPEKRCSFYKACLLHAECYMYRKLYSFFENSMFLKNFDYFGKIKETAFTSCISDILSLAKYTRRTDDKYESFAELLIINLWSNRNDYSFSNDNDPTYNKKILNQLSLTNPHILVNESHAVWLCLNTVPQKGKQQQVDIICDNVGYELFADLILAEYMIEKGLASRVRFHVKAHPWFISDVTANDFHWTLNYLCEHSDYIINLMGKKFQQFLNEGKFELAPISHFWTSPYAFFSMRDVVPGLYTSLSESKLIIFKGDLNYRKLLGDVCWDSTKDFKTCLRGFLPTNFCTIRTVKAEVICGMPEGLCDDLSHRDPQWMITGNYGIIQFVDATKGFGY